MRLSVVIPAYNKEKQLPRLLASVLDSPAYGRDVEVIVVDDASTDRTPDLMASVLRIHPEVRYLRHSANGGVHAARNTGIESAKGDWIAFIDGDDYLIPSGLSAIIRSIGGTLDAVDCLFLAYRTSDTGESTGFAHAGDFTLDDVFLRPADTFRRIKGCLPIVRRALLMSHAIRFRYTNMDSAFYREVHARAVSRCVRFIDEVVGIYDRGNGASLSRKRSRLEHRLKVSNEKFLHTLEHLNALESYMSNHPELVHRILDNAFHDFMFCVNKPQKALSLIRYSRLIGIAALTRFMLFSLFPLSLVKIAYQVRRFLGSDAR